MACEPAAATFRALRELRYPCALTAPNNQTIRSYPVGNCLVPWQDNWKNTRGKLQPTEISPWSGSGGCCSPGSRGWRRCPPKAASAAAAAGSGNPLALLSKEEGKILEQAVLVFWFSFTLVMPPPRYTKHLIPDFLPLAAGRWRAVCNVFLPLSGCQLLSSVKNS